MKTCKKCNEEKDFDSFKKHAKSPDGHTSICKTCASDKTDAQAQIDELAAKLDGVVESTNDALEEVSKQFEGFAAKIEQMFSSMAKNNPVSIRKGFSAAEQDLGGSGVAHFAESEDENEEPTVIQPVNQPLENPYVKAKAEALAFMRELVRVYIHTTNEKNADQVFEVGINGRKQIFIRGKEFVVPRFFVEGLARARPIHYDNEEYTDRNGDKAYRWPARRGLRYAFDVIEDRNPKGRQWLKSVLAAA